MSATRFFALLDGKCGAYGVVFPDLPGCTAMGDTIAAALRHATAAAAEWSDAVGKLPQPRALETLRVDPEVKRALARGESEPMRSFQQLVSTANQVAAEFNGARDTCILTCFALHNVLQRLGYNSRPLRIEAAIFPNDQKLSGNILGSIERGARRAASPDMWWGHLGVVVDNDWLLDPTLDQANKKEWSRTIHVGPLAVRLEEKFWAEWGSILGRVLINRDCSAIAGCRK